MKFEIKHVKYVVVGFFSLLFLTFALRELRNWWNSPPTHHGTTTATQKEYDPIPSSSNRRVVSLSEDAWTRFECPPEGSPRRSFRFERVDPNLWIEYMTDNDTNTIIVIPPRNHSAYKPVVINPGIGKKVKCDIVRVHKHPDNPPNRDVQVYYVE